MKNNLVKVEEKAEPKKSDVVMYKTDCNFRKRLKVCNMKVENCRGYEEGLDWADYCHLYDLKWDIKSLKKEGKELFKKAQTIEKSLKELKQTDKEKYHEAKNQIKDLFHGGIFISKAIMWIKRTGNLELNKSEKKVADVLMKKLKNGKKS